MFLKICEDMRLYVFWGEEGIYSIYDECNGRYFYSLKGYSMLWLGYLEVMIY